MLSSLIFLQGNISQYFKRGTFLIWSTSVGMHSYLLQLHYYSSWSCHMSVPGGKLVGQAGWFRPLQCRALWRAWCSWCKGLPLSGLKPPSGWCSYCCSLTGQGPDVHTYRYAITSGMQWKWAEIECYYLSTGNVYGCYQVSCMCVKSTDAASHGRAHQVFIYVHLH